MTPSLNRPRYHFLPPANWMNDPNGLIQWRGEYHLFYQYNPLGAFHANIHWGHAVSRDLVHWEHLPIALAPEPGGPDQDGCWSGVIVNNAGQPTAIYTGVHPQTVCVAFGSPDLRSWQKAPQNPVLAAPVGDGVLGFRDPCVWQEDGSWRMVVGFGTAEAGGIALLYQSKDLIRWESLGALCSSQQAPAAGPWQADMWECPDFFALGGSHVLVVSELDEQQGRPVGVVALVGQYAASRFQPQLASPLDHGDAVFYAPQSFCDEQGRRIQFGWLREQRSEADLRTQGWAGVMSLPRELFLTQDGRLGVRPAAEVATLRRPGLACEDLLLAAHLPDPLAGQRGVNWELELELADPSGPMVLGLRASPDGCEQTRVRLDPMDGTVEVDRSASSLDPQAPRSPVRAHVDLAPHEPVRLHLFLDGSTLEMFIGETFCLTTRIYPTRADSDGLWLRPQADDLLLSSLNLWPMTA